ncbi:MAG: hypothetical protein ACYCW6_15670, partial [Candidatus Xenobia bacterium]
GDAVIDKHCVLVAPRHEMRGTGRAGDLVLQPEQVRGGVRILPAVEVVERLLEGLRPVSSCTASLPLYG